MGGVGIGFWIGFHILIFSILALDLGVFNKKAHEVPLKEALLFTLGWILLALLFNVFVFFEFGHDRALEFLTGYLIEYSLSVDNIFVFILIFSFFAIPARFQHKVLFWGIIGALILRAMFIFAGVALIRNFHWIVIVFGTFLIFTGIRMLFKKEGQDEPGKNPVIRYIRKILPVTDELHGNKFFIRQDGKRIATILFLSLLVIEVFDLIFAIDSIPAVIAVSRNTFIIYTSNIFAILGLRSLFFAVSGIMGYFRFLNVGLAFILSFVGFKMVASFFNLEIPITLSLGIIVSILVISILASLLLRKK